MNPKELPVKLPVGKLFIGSEYHGCCNTGNRPAMLHSKRLDDWKSLNVHNYRFAVGPELWVSDACQEYLAGKIKNASWIRGSRKVKFFKTYKGAKKYFLELQAEVERFNVDTSNREKDLRDRAAKGDVDAAVSLTDF